MTNHYFVHVALKAARNYRLGLERLTWGWKAEALEKRNNAFGGVRNRDLVAQMQCGDILVLGHRGPDPRRLSDLEYAQGVFREVSVFTVRRPLYTSSEALWEDALYPDRVGLRLEERGEMWGKGALGLDGMVALKRSANASGVAIPSRSGLMPFQVEVMTQSVTGDLSEEATDDAYTWAVRRREQSRLRSLKLRGREQAPCDICGRDLPAALLRAAHIKRRADCGTDERAELANVMLACVLGCDAMFELGHISIDNSGRITALKRADGDLGTVVASVVGRRVTSDARVLKFARDHRAFHGA